MRRIAFALTLLTSVLAWTAPAAADESEAIAIETSKPFGPFPGVFSLSGILEDDGIFFSIRPPVFSASGAPDFQITHVTYEFVGELGTFILRAEIKEAFTADFELAVDTGTWVILDGTGAYETLHGHGDVIGVADESTGIITRSFVGVAHLK